MSGIRKIFFVLFLVFAGLSSIVGQQNQHKAPDVIMHLPPVAEFSWLNACFGDTTKFINQSLLASGYFWSIYDSAGNIIDTSSSQDISFYFSASGTYTVSLDADNGHITNITKVITIGNTTIADFSFQHCANNFNNMSACAINFLWDFGDGSTTTDSLPVHQYSDTGHYQATLIACNGLICDTVKKLIYVDAIATPDPSFTLSQSADTLFYQMNNFMPYETITWYFGDGTSAILTAAQSYHIYQDTGNFSVSVQVINNCGMQFSFTSVYMMFPLTGIATNSELKTDINIYPNPFNSQLMVEANSVIIEKIILLDIIGNTVLAVENNKTERKNNIPVSNLTSGQYFARIITTQGVLNKKIIKN